MMDLGPTIRRGALALALLPIVVVAYGLGLPFDPSVEIGLQGASYFVLVLGTLSVAYAGLLWLSERSWIRSRSGTSMIDPLTGLPRFDVFRDRLQQALLMSEREGSHVPLVFMQVDRFSEISHALGREKTEMLLMQLAERVHSVLRDSDTLARGHGGEFFVLLPSAADGQGAFVVIEKVRGALRQPFVLDHLPVDLKATFGVAVSPGHGREADGLIKSAGSALEAARDRGVPFEMFNPDRHELTGERIALMGELRKAIEDHQLVLFYQPKRSMDNGGGIKGVEALVRWVHPTRGFIPPDQFIPLAEQTDLIRPLSLYILEEAIKQAGEWRMRGLDICVAVNISANNLEDDLPSQISTLLDKWSVPVDAIELEVTESAVMNDQSRAIAVLETLSEMGLKIAVDDYGAGYTSLTYLTRLPVSSLKIDKSFVQNMIEQRRDALVVRSTIGLAQDLDLDVVAEGVETQEVWDELARLGCNTAQGYFISKPLPADQLSLN